MTQAPINLTEKLSTFSERWSPKIIGGYNGNDLMLVKVKGEFVWHSHPETDDFFMVLKGQLTIKLRDGDVVLNAGDVYVVPKGVEHCPVAKELPKRSKSVEPITLPGSVLPRKILPKRSAKPFPISK